MAVQEPQAAPQEIPEEELEHMGMGEVEEKEPK